MDWYVTVGGVWAPASAQMSFRHTGPEMRQNQFQTETSPSWCCHTTPAGWFQPVSCCVLPEICSSIPDTASCAPSLNPSTKKHRTSIASVPPTPHHHHLQTSSFANASPPHPPTHTHHLNLRDLLVQTTTPRSGAFLPLFLSTTPKFETSVWKTLVTRQKANCPWCTAKPGCVSEQWLCPCDSCNLAVEWVSA